MLGVCLHEDSAALSDGDLLTLYLKDARAFKHDVELVVLVRLLSVGLRGNEHIDPHLEASGFVDDLIATTGLPKPFSDGCDFEWVHAANLLHTRTISRRTLSSPTVFIELAQP
jgi:hypothetical protein